MHCRYRDANVFELFGLKNSFMDQTGKLVIARLVKAFKIIIANNDSYLLPYN